MCCALAHPGEDSLMIQNHDRRSASVHMTASCALQLLLPNPRTGIHGSNAGGGRHDESMPPDTLDQRIMIGMD